MRVVNDYVPNDIRPLNINLEQVSLNIKYSITSILNEHDCANNSRKMICSGVVSQLRNKVKCSLIPKNFSHVTHAALVFNLQKSTQCSKFFKVNEEN